MEMESTPSADNGEMAGQISTIRLSRYDAQPWGFRLQGGMDFGTPLVVQKVNGGSLSEQAGLLAGDALLKVNNVDVYNMRHKDAQDLIVRSGNNFDITIQRGGSVWRPQVTPTGSLPSPTTHLNQMSPVTKTSLAHKHQEIRHIGSGHNSAARPFSSVNGGDGQVKSIVNKQYNTPVGIYSEEAIAETLSAQAEVLAGGVLGVNFKKNEKIYNAANSEVLKMLHEQENDKDPDEPHAPANFFWTASHAVGGAAGVKSHRRDEEYHQQQQQQLPGPHEDECIGTPLQQNTLAPSAPHRPSLPTQAVSAPTFPSYPPPSTYNPSQQPQSFPPQSIPAPISAVQPPAPAPIPKIVEEAPKHGGGMACESCGVTIAGVFVRIKDKNLHAECFKCATCGTNLKNQGYYNFNNKLYCDIHARLAAMNNPPKGTEGYSPVPIKPSTQLSANTISAALNTHSQHNGSNHDPALTVMSSVSPSLSHTHSRTSSLSSSSLNSLAGISSSSQSSTMSRLSPDKLMSSPEKLSPAHSRQSSESGSTNVFGHHPTSFHQTPGSGSVATIRTNSRTMSPVMSFPPPPPPPPLPFDKQTMSPAATRTYSNEITINHRPKEIPDARILSNGVSENGVGRTINGGISNGCSKGGDGDSNTVSGGDFVEGGDGEQQHVLSQSNVYNKFLKKYTNKMQNDFLDGPATNGSNHKSYSATKSTCGTTNPTPVTTDRINDSSVNSASIKMASSVTDPFLSKTNGYAENGDSIYGTIRPHNGGRKDSLDEFKYVTLDGSVIRSVVPPGKGVRTNYKINTGYGGPKPFNSSPMSPPMRGPQSPSTYPPPTNVQSWDQPRPQPKPQVNPYATLPRTTGQSQEESRQQQCFMYQQQQVYEQQETDFKKERSVFEEDIEIIEANKQQVGHFAWPPPRDENRCTPTATPLYIAPPETQHVVPKPLVEKPPEQQSQWQSRSAPELTTSAAAQQKTVVEIESSSDSYTSTSTTTTTTSEEYQRMYQAQAQAYQMQQTYEQYGSEMDYHMDMEVAAMQPDLSSSGYFYSSQSGRRSAQECVDYIAGPVSTYHLIDLVRAATPKPETPPPKPQRKVEFSDDIQIQHTAQVSCEDTQKPLAIEKEAQLEKSLKSVVEHAEKGEENEETQLDQHEDELRVVHTQVTPENRMFTATPEIKIEIPEVKPIPPSKIPNPVPKEWISPMVKALTTAPDKPVEMAESVASEPVKMFESVHFHEEKSIKTQEVSQTEQPAAEPKVLEEEPPKGSFLSKTMTTAPSDPVMFAPKIDDPIPLPEESEPYMPPPMDMKPYLREDYRPKSPFLNALTIAPDRSYTPYGHDVCSQLLDLPTPKEKLTMTDALTVASSRCYTPLDSTNANAIIESEKKKANTYQFFSDVSESSQTKNIDSEINRQISAFANVKGACTSCPFQPRQESLNSNATDTVQSSRQNSLIPQVQILTSERRDSQHHQSQDRKQSMFQPMSCATSACTATSYNSMNQKSCCQSSTTCKKEQQQEQYKTATTVDRQQQKSQQEKTEQESEQKISFPPPLGPMAKKTLHSGLHKPDSIPQYQRNWTVLPSQRPVRTPEPPELKENVPLAFVETPTPRELTPSVESTAQAKSCAASNMVSSMSQQQHAASTLTETKVSEYHHQQQQYQQQQCTKQEYCKNTLPIIVTESDAPVTMAFQSLDIDHGESHSRPYTPSLINKPAPIIPYYQTPAKLVAEECSATQARLYDPRSPSPLPDRARSPAPGPPPNPLNSIRAPRLKELNTEVAPSYRPPIQTGSITTGQSYYGTQQAQFQTVEHGQLVSHQQQGYQAGSQTFVDKPEVVQQRQIGNTSIQTRAKESRMNEENRSAMETKSTTQVGNMQIERRRKVVEEYEHSQTAKSVEIRTNQSGDSKQTVQHHKTGRTGFVANQARRLSNLEQEISSVSSQSQAIAARAAHLGNINHPPPLPNLTTMSDEIKKQVGKIDSLDLPPPPPPLPGALNGNNSPPRTMPTRAANQLPKTLNTGPVTGNRTPKPFQPGTATEMLASSLEKVEINDKQKFRDEAGKIISAMLENRLAQKTNTSLTKELDSDHPMKKIIDVCDNPQTEVVREPSVDANVNQTSGLILEVSTDGKILSGSPTEHGPSESVVYRNKSTNPNGKRELSTHAFDRRSYIDTNSNNNQDAISQEVNGNTDNTTTLVSDLKDGKEPVCCQCNAKITRGPFITALGRIWCPDHFVCVNGNCRRALQDIGFVEEKGDLYCEFCFEKFLAPTCSKCSTKIKGDCLNAIGKHYHPECFSCSYCGKHFGNSPFFLEEGEPYCEADWNELFTTKCFACGFPVEAGDRWVEALSHNYHSQCFNCTMCKKNLEGQSFYNKGGRPFCKNHAR